MVCCWLSAPLTIMTGTDGARQDNVNPEGLFIDNFFREYRTKDIVMIFSGHLMSVSRVLPNLFLM